MENKSSTNKDKNNSIKNPRYSGREKLLVKFMLNELTSVDANFIEEARKFKGSLEVSIGEDE